MNTDALYESLEKLINAGDEAAARAYLADHFKEFPEDSQKEITLILFEDAMNEYAEAVEERQAFIEDATQTLDNLANLRGLLEKRKAELTDEGKLGDVRKNLGLE